MSDWDYATEIEIDANRLDIEWLNHAERTHGIAEALAHKEAELAQAEESRKIIEAEISSDVRINPVKHHLDKITEAAVSNVLTLHPDCRDARKTCMRLEEEVALLKAAVNGMRDKKSALENLVVLHGQNYFASPSIPHSLSNEMKESMREMTDKDIKKKVCKSINKNRE